MTESDPIDGYDFFLAHSVEVLYRARELYDALIANGHRVFFESESLIVGDLWDQVLPRAQAMSRITVVLVSSKPTRSYNYREGIAMALYRSRIQVHRVVPVYIDGKRPKHVPFGLRRLHGIEVDSSGIEGIVARLERALADTIEPALHHQLARHLKALYPLATHRVGLATAVELDPSAAEGTVDEFLAQLGGRRELLRLVRTVLEDIRALGREEGPEHRELIELEACLQDQARNKHRTLHAWFERVRDQQKDLLSFRPKDRELDLATAIVRVQVAGRCAGENDLEHCAEYPVRLQTDLSLEPQLLDEVIDGDAGNRWTLVGNPGAGKTTLLCRLAGRRAEDGIASIDRGETPKCIPIYLRIEPWDSSHKTLIDHLVEEFRGGSSEDVPDLKAMLREALMDGRALLLLDGLDELDTHRVAKVARNIKHLAQAWTKSTIVVSSRPHGYVRPSEAFGELELLPLDADGRLALARSWLDEGRATILCQRIERDANLRDLAGVPLLMAMICLVEREGEHASGLRVKLYQRVVSLLLLGKPVDGRPTQEISRRGVAEPALEELSLGLVERGGIEWSLRDVEDALLAGARYGDLQRAFPGGTNQFLREVENVTGLLFAVDKNRTRFRYVHRSLLEYLAARALLDRQEYAVWRKFIARGSEGRWAEVVSLLAGLLDKKPALSLLKILAKHNPGLGLRALATCDALGDAVLEVLQIGRLQADWSGTNVAKERELSDRRRYILSLPERLGDPGRAVQLLERLLPEATVLDLALIWQALASLVTLGVGEARTLLVRERFFQLAGRPTRVVPVTWVTIRPGTFWMGSQKSELGRVDWEGPRHRVAITYSFEVMTTPVTDDLYRIFAPEHEPTPGPASRRHPVTSVSWYEAMIFAVWMGARLPTEAEWEYSCRAGTETATYSGDLDDPVRTAVLDPIAWYADGSNGTHPVGEKQPNPWGLYDMLGNVWEWCVDGKRDYGSTLERSIVGVLKTVAARMAATVQDPVGVTDDERYFRVSRGGAWINSAKSCRAASRDWRAPESRNTSQGMRLFRDRK